MENVKSVSLFSNGHVVLFDENGQQTGDGRLNMIELVLLELEKRGVDIYNLKNIWTIVNGNQKFVQPFKGDDGEIRISFVDF